MAKWVAIALLGLTVLAGCGSGDDEEATSEGEMQIALTAQNDSGQDGTAVLAEIDDSTTRVEITVANPGSEPQPAHIHRGSCDRLDPQPEYPLSNVVDGKSTSEVSASLEDLVGQGFAINVHKSEAEAQTYVACGDIASGPGGTETGEGETETGETETGETETGETETGETETGEGETETTSDYGY
jgi:hypothetical protein